MQERGECDSSVEVEAIEIVQQVHLAGGRWEVHAQALAQPLEHVQEDQRQHHQCVKVVLCDVHTLALQQVPRQHMQEHPHSGQTTAPVLP